MVQKSKRSRRFPVTEEKVGSSPIWIAKFWAQGRLVRHLTVYEAYEGSIPFALAKFQWRVRLMVRPAPD